MSSANTSTLRRGRMSSHEASSDANEWARKKKEAAEKAKHIKEERMRAQLLREMQSKLDNDAQQQTQALAEGYAGKHVPSLALKGDLPLPVGQLVIHSPRRRKLLSWELFPCCFADTQARLAVVAVVSLLFPLHDIITTFFHFHAISRSR